MKKGRLNAFFEKERKQKLAKQSASYKKRLSVNNGSTRSDVETIDDANVQLCLPFIWHMQ